MSVDFRIAESPEFRCRFPEWRDWAESTARRIGSLWAQCRHGEKEGAEVRMLLLTRVKSYAPRVDHLVLDLRCS